MQEQSRHHGRAAAGRAAVRCAMPGVALRRALGSVGARAYSSAPQILLRRLRARSGRRSRRRAPGSGRSLGSTAAPGPYGPCGPKRSSALLACFTELDVSCTFACGGRRRRGLTARPPAWPAAARPRPKSRPASRRRWSTSLWPRARRRSVIMARSASRSRPVRSGPRAVGGQRQHVQTAAAKPKSSEPTSTLRWRNGARARIMPSGNAWPRCKDASGTSARRPRVRETAVGISRPRPRPPPPAAWRVPAWRNRSAAAAARAFAPWCAARRRSPPLLPLRWASPSRRPLPLTQSLPVRLLTTLLTTDATRCADNCASPGTGRRAAAAARPSTAPSTGLARR